MAKAKERKPNKTLRQKPSHPMTKDKSPPNTISPKIKALPPKTQKEAQ
jgi:hypothetical protein